jgi:L-rhamnose isomerase/sugar isomerase
MATQLAGDVLRGHEILLDAFSTDVRPLCAKVRGELGAAEDPLGELRSTGYVELQTRQRAAETMQLKG